MKIATYNVWNENNGKGNRFNQLIQEIKTVDADIIALQEVTEHFFKNHLTTELDYKYCEFRQYRNEDEGLAILSKYEIKDSFFLNTSEEFSYSAALNVVFQVGELKYSFTNVHLPWDSAKIKEQQIVAIDRYIHEHKEQVDWSILLGDFNGSLNSSVHRYLLGEQTINDAESKPYWFEVSSTYAEINKLMLKPTLDFLNNPRWGGKNTIEIPIAVDRIYILNNWYNVAIKSVEIFGTDISASNGLSASDHYGVITDVDFAK